MAFCCQCGKKASRKCAIDTNSKTCKECTDKGLPGITDKEAENLAQHSGSPLLSQDYWENMNKLLDDKFQRLEQRFKDSILGEVKQITDPIEKQVNELKAENRKLKSEVTLLKASKEEHKEKFEKMEKTLLEHKKTLAQNDRDARMKRLLLSGMPEEDIILNGESCKSDP